MKKNLLILSIILFGVAVFAQSPQAFKYQAVARNSLGEVLVNIPVKFRISIIQGTATGTAVYSELHSRTTNNFGLVDLEIGKGTSPSGSFSAINWGVSIYFIKVEMDPAGGTTFQTLGTSQLLSVPYALYAKTAATSTDAVTKAYVDMLQTEISKLQNTIVAGGFITDVEGNRYNIVIIGPETWMAENLRTTKFNDGTDLPDVTDNSVWEALTTCAYCWYNNDAATNKNTYGALYNWFSVNTGKLCPEGWHVPNDAERARLENYLIANGYNYDGSTAGNKIAKSLAVTTDWTTSSNSGSIGNTDYTAYRNKTGFSALPGGVRYNGYFYNFGDRAAWWSSSEITTATAWTWYLETGTSNLWHSLEDKKSGHSVRCVRDILLTITTSPVIDVTQTDATGGGNITSDGHAVVTDRGVCWSINQNPTINNSTTIDGSGTGTFTSKISGLTANTTYYVRAYATHSQGTAYGNQLTFNTTGTLTDIDGNVYKTIKTGDRIWMAENLKTTKYNGGTAILYVTNNGEWSNLPNGGYCWYNNDPGNKTTYGALYNWYAVSTGTICPKGWHVPSDAEWTSLVNYLIANGYNYDGTTTGNKIAKSLAATINWTESSVVGAVGNADYPGYRNKSGFSAFPGGYRYDTGLFLSIGNIGCWWSSAEYSPYFSWDRMLSNGNVSVDRSYDSKKYGYSVRCVRD